MNKSDTKAKKPVQAVVDADKPESQLAAMWESLKTNKAAMVGLVLILILALISLVVWVRELMGKQILPFDPNSSDMTKSFIFPNSVHWFGTDQLGRDVFSRVLDGTKISLFVGIAAVAISMTIGVIFGSIAGYRGGKIDTVIMRFMDMMLAIPSIPEYARIVRGSILSAKENDYVQAARVIGNKDTRIIFRHILPNVISSIVVRATLGISSAILDTAALGFLGLGVQPPYAEWGDMLGRARGFIFSAPYTLIFPGVAITITVLAFNLFGDGLRDALDPKSRIR